MTMKFVLLTVIMMMTIVAICLLVKEVPPQPQLLIKQLLSLLATEISPPPLDQFLGDQTQLFRFHQFKLRLDCIEHTLNLGVGLKPYISLMLLCSYVDNLYHQPSVYFIFA